MIPTLCVTAIKLSVVGAGRARDDGAITLQSLCKYRGRGPLLRRVDVLKVALCVVTQSGTLRRPEPLSGSGCIPTQSVGMMSLFTDPILSPISALQPSLVEDTFSPPKLWRF